MTANELADELAFKHIAGDDNGAFSSKIITMLRQQQAEIEQLKALAISLSHRNANLQYTKVSENDIYICQRG